MQARQAWHPVAMRPMIMCLAMGLSACGLNETAARYGAANHVWQLRDLDGVAFPATATLRFPAPGKISGSGPCNSYSGAMTAPYPWFEVGDLVATEQACADLGFENAFFDALQEMAEIEVSGRVLILRNTDGQSMVFQAAGGA